MFFFSVTYFFATVHIFDHLCTSTSPFLGVTGIAAPWPWPHGVEGPALREGFRHSEHRRPGGLLRRQDWQIALGQTRGAGAGP